MLSLLFRKSFVDLWDHFFPALILNMLHLGLAVGYYFLGGFVPQGSLLGQFVLILGLLLVSYGSLLLFLSRVRRSPAGPGIRTWVAAFLLALVQTTVIAAGSLAVQFYFSGALNPTWLLGAVSAWMLVSWLAASQLLPAVLWSTDGRFFSALRQAFRLALTSPGQVSLVWILGLALGLTAAILVPGPAYGFLLSANLQIFLERKQKWLETASEDDLNGPVPWKELLADYRESLRHRRPHSLLFPWK